MSLFPFLGEIRLSGDNDNVVADLKDSKFKSVLCSEHAKALLKLDFGREEPFDEGIGKDWNERLSKSIVRRLDQTSREKSDEKQILLVIALAALCSFIQANVTGPPLDWSSAETCFPNLKRADVPEVQRILISDLSVDGEAAYRLIPHVELFSLASMILNHPLIYGQEGSFVWARLRVNFLHQQLLNEISYSLQSLIYQDISSLDSSVLGNASQYGMSARVLYLLERAAVDTHHGFDKKAREDLNQATNLRNFEYVLTGRLGKRTKFQQNDISQLVVLARSQTEKDSDNPGRKELLEETEVEQNSIPRNLDINDDTLLESISFTSQPETAVSSFKDDIPKVLEALEPSNQPTLHPLDSIILLSVASSITNTLPEHGLTREETLPYATRVLESGSTNWQIYTQALLVRSRIEGYRSRTVERGVLQMQVLVDQIITETKGTTTEEVGSSDSATTFLPRPRASESAPVSERLMYIHQLASPLTWSLETELASRWVGLGSLKTALEIFERLELWAEAALCWAATDREDKARQIIREQLYRNNETAHRAEGEENTKQDSLNEENVHLPNDAPRLFCILGDLEKDPKHYERAWRVSNERFARAQRSLGKHYLAKRELEKADDAYSKSLAINPQNAGAWFSLGCIRLETTNWAGAVQAFTRSVQIEEDDAEAWSNLAAALLRLPVEPPAVPSTDRANDDELTAYRIDPLRHRKEAFVALKKATTLKRDSYRIWQNLLNVAATMIPPPYTDIVIAQQSLIRLQGRTEGENCIDVEVLEGLLSHIIASESPAQRDGAAENEPVQRRHGIEGMFTDLVQKDVIPLITKSRRIWQLVARLAIYQNRPSSALDGYEKAWRTTLNQPGWDNSSDVTSSTQTEDSAWQQVVDSTMELADAYESLGEKEVTEGLGSGSGELVCKNWRYKARMAIRSVIGRRTKAGFEDVSSLTEKMGLLK